MSSQLGSDMTSQFSSFHYLIKIALMVTLYWRYLIALL